MSIRRTSGLVGALALALVVTGCSSSDGKSDAEGKGKTRVFAADNGKITIPEKPKRVVATGYAVPALIEADAPLVGISSWKRGEPMMDAKTLATYKKLPKVAGELATETNYDAIAEAEPDLIVIGVPAPVLGDIDVKRLEGIAPVVAIGPTKPSAWRTLSHQQADAAGSLKQFDAVKTQYETKAAALKEKYKGVLPKLKFGHLGSYGESAKGTFQREFSGSWGTNIAEDAGAVYYGKVKNPGPGSKGVSEYPSIEELPASFREADVITYSVKADGSLPESVKYAMDSKLWKNLPAVKAGKTIPIRYTEAATYGQGMQTLDAIDKAFAPLLKP
ncbi:ABC transporter substrate-binding protein [Streptomyces sp. NPDC050504]|uniref:ABC transporter substrate-binding protein n=1 Tax=Streptomyces sp. NPDC050504 TaxID=3365618 RepID=UPI003793E753